MLQVVYASVNCRPLFLSLFGIVPTVPLGFLYGHNTKFDVYYVELKDRDYTALWNLTHEIGGCVIK